MLELTPSQRLLCSVTTSSQRLLRANAPSAKCQTLKSVVLHAVVVAPVAHVAKVVALVVHVVSIATVTTAHHVHAMTAHVSIVMIAAHAMTVHALTEMTEAPALATIVAQHAVVVANSGIASSALTIDQHVMTAHALTAMTGLPVAETTVATIVQHVDATTALVSTETASATIVHHVHAMTAQHAGEMIVLRVVTTGQHVDLAAQARARALDHAEIPLVDARSLHAVTKTHE